MTLDLRLVIGRLLLAIGLQLVAYSFFSEGRGASMNLLWGSVISAGGLAFHLFARFGKTA